MTPETLGHYQIVEKLSEGGWGIVYLAHDGRLERDVALKVLSAGTLADEDARKQFRREALTIAKVNHPSIAHIYDFDTQAGVDFLVMEYVSGSRSKRSFNSGLEERCCGSTLIATSRPSLVSRARYTSPMPPAPIAAAISYGPSFAPGKSGIQCR